MGGNCKTVVFLPIISVSTKKIEYENKLSINDLITINTLIDKVFFRVLDTVSSQLFSKRPSAFNFPLLI